MVGCIPARWVHRVMPRAEAVYHPPQLRSPMIFALHPRSDIRHLCQQLGYSYSANCHSAAPVHLHLLGMGGKIAETANKVISGELRYCGCVAASGVVWGALLMAAGTFKAPASARDGD